MHHLLPSVLLLAVLIGAAAPNAQSGVSAAQVVGFGGTWALDPAGSQAGPGERRVISVTTDGMAVTIDRDDTPPVTLFYKFDGSESVIPFGSGTATSSLRQEAGHPLTVAVFIVNDAPVTV